MMFYVILLHARPWIPGDEKSIFAVVIETVSPEGTFCDTVQVPTSAEDMELH